MRIFQNANISPTKVADNDVIAMVFLWCKHKGGKARYQMGGLGSLSIFMFVIC